MFFKIGVAKNFAMFKRKQLCWSLFLIKLQVFRTRTLLKRNPAQEFSCEYCEISRNTFSYGRPPIAASGEHPLIVIKSV